MTLIVKWVGSQFSSCVKGMRDDPFYRVQVVLVSAQETLGNRRMYISHVDSGGDFAQPLSM